MSSVVVGLFAILLAGEPSKIEPTGDIRGRFQEILAEHESSQESFRKRYKSANDAQKDQLAGDNSKRMKDLARRALAVAQSDPGNSATIDIITWIVSEPLGVIYEERNAAFDLLRLHHAGSDQLIPAIKAAGSSDRCPDAAESFLREVVDRNAHRELCGHARLSLATLLKAMHADAKYLEQHPEAAAPLAAKIGERSVVRLRSSQREGWANEAETLFEQVIVKFKDIKYDENENLGDMAERELFEMRYLTIGKIAPEIVGEDIEGKPMRLSDFRGKVVVLDFWSHRGCSVCRTLYPHDRSLVDRLRDKPFAFLGINCDEKREDVKAVMRDGQVTWRAWWDGDVTGSPIHNRWNVSEWPTIYVLDGNGVIRFKDVRGDELDDAVNFLLKESENATRTKKQWLFCNACG